MLGLSLGLFDFIFTFSVPYFGLACDHGNTSFLYLEELRKRRYWIEVRAVFNVKTTAQKVRVCFDTMYGTTYDIILLFLWYCTVVYYILLNY